MPCSPGVFKANISQIARELLRKRDFFLIKLINRQGVIILRRRELPCEFFAATVLSGRSSRVPPCNRASALAPRFPFISSKIALFLFSPLMTTAEKRACRKRDQPYSFPAKLLFAYCELLGFRHFIGWRLFVLTCLSDKACHVYKSLEGENSYSFFERVLPLSTNL